MSEGQPDYRIQQLMRAKQQISAIAALARSIGKLNALINLLKEAEHNLRFNPNDWGDPERRLPKVGGVLCHGIVRPLVFRYIIFEQVRSVVLLTVQKFADFP